jgi:hypothetical protein
MTEIGSAFAAMTGKDRMAAITKSLEENDDSLVSSGARRQPVSNEPDEGRARSRS